MTALDQIKKDFTRLSHFTRSKSSALFYDPSLLLLSREFSTSPTPSLRKELLEQLKLTYSENIQHLQKMVQRAGSLGSFHSLWLSKELPLSLAQKVLNAPQKTLSHKHSRLFNQQRRDQYIQREANRTLANLENGLRLEQIAKTKGGMTSSLERIWRTESHQKYNHCVKTTLKKTGGILQAVEVLDSRTRSQSLYINGTLSDSEGRFLYPDGGRYVLGHSGKPEWDINDRGIAVPYRGEDIRTLEVGKDIPPPRSLALELIKTLVLDLAIKELFEILFRIQS